VRRKPGGSCSLEIAANANDSTRWNRVAGAHLKRSCSELEAEARLVIC
jgi:hypothetical protein